MPRLIEANSVRSNADKKAINNLRKEREGTYYIMICRMKCSGKWHWKLWESTSKVCRGISGLVAEYIVAIDVTRVRFPDDAHCWNQFDSLTVLHVLVEIGCVECCNFKPRKSAAPQGPKRSCLHAEATRWEHHAPERLQLSSWAAF